MKRYIGHIHNKYHLDIILDTRYKIRYTHNTFAIRNHLDLHNYLDMQN